MNPDVLDDILSELVVMFAEQEDRLVRDVATALRRTPLEELEVRADVMRRLSDRSASAAAAVRERSGPLAERLIALAVSAGERDAHDWVQRALGAVTETRHGAFATALLAQELHERFDDATRRIVRWAPDTYQAVIARTTPGVLLGTDTTRTSMVRAWRDLRRQGITGYRDTAGRRWNLATYTEMATRTATMRAYRESSLQTYASYGLDLVTPIGGGGLCSECGRWVGRVLSQGQTPTGRVPVQHATEDRTVTVTVAGTVEQATTDGWGHPNCRCVMVGYFPGMQQPTGPDHDQAAEDAQQDLRALEVRLRRAKRDQAGWITPDDRDRADAKVRELEKRITEHVATTGEPRRREREEPDMDFHHDER